MADPNINYFEMFGHFMNQFANVEAMVHALFRRTTGLPDSEARLISRGMRLRDVIDITRRLARAKEDMPEKHRTLMEESFQQLALISALRHILVHRGVRIEGEDVISSNARTVRVKEDTEILRLKVKDIQAAALDLGVIFLRFLALYHAKKGWQKPELMLKDEPWLYKPLKPETPYR